MSKETRSWAEQTFGDAKLGDKRRTERLVKIASDKADAVHLSIPEYSDGKSEEATYRFARNKNIASKEIIDAGCSATATLAEQIDGVMLVIQDSTTLSFPHQIEGSGPLGGPDNSGRGVWVHTAIIVEQSSRKPVGIAAQKIWARGSQVTGARKKRKYEEKESYRWEESCREVGKKLSDKASANTILLADREAANIELLGYLNDTGQRYILRARKGWKCKDAKEVLTPSKYKVLGNKELELVQRGNPNGRSKHRITLQIRAGRTELHSQSKRYPGAIKVNVIHALELNPRKGSTPMEWWLLTSEPVQSLEEAWENVERYQMRWLIEDFHKAWKSGAKVEELRFQSMDNMLRYATILGFIALRLLQLRELVGQEPKASAERFFTPMQWKVLWLIDQERWKKSKRTRKPPKKVPSIKWAYETLAKLGGFKDSKRTGRAGWSALWKGYFNLEGQVEGFLLALKLVGREL